MDLTTEAKIRQMWSELSDEEKQLWRVIAKKQRDDGTAEFFPASLAAEIGWSSEKVESMLRRFVEVGLFDPPSEPTAEEKTADYKRQLDTLLKRTDLDDVDMVAVALAKFETDGVLPDTQAVAALLSWPEERTLLALVALADTSQAMGLVTTPSQGSN